MSHSIRKSLAAAALILGCGIVCLCSLVDAGDPPFVTEAGGGINPIGSDPDEVCVPNPVLVPAPLRPPSEKERQIFKRIRAAWQARHERIRSLHIAWDSPSGRTGSGALSPNEQTEVWIDHDFRMRARTSYRGYSRPSVYLTTFDGMTTRTWNSDKHEGEVCNGQLERGLPHGVGSMWRLAIDPFYCGALKIASPDVNVLCEDTMLGDRHCMQLRFPVKVDASDYKTRDTLWIDPARDNLIVRWDRTLQESASACLSIEYTRDKQHGWLPSQWRETYSWSSGNSATATRIAINEQYPVSTFRLTFPPGTEVRDRKLAQRYVIGPDGSKTQIEQFHPVELETIYDSLNRTTDFVIDPEPLERCARLHQPALPHQNELRRPGRPPRPDRSNSPGRDRKARHQAQRTARPLAQTIAQTAAIRNPQRRGDCDRRRKIVGRINRSETLSPLERFPFFLLVEARKAQAGIWWRCTGN